MKDLLYSRKEMVSGLISLTCELGERVNFEVKNLNADVSKYI
jgi:hypothetical protein